MVIAEAIRKQEFFVEFEKKCDNSRLAAATMFFCEDETTSRIALILAAMKIQFPQNHLLFDENSSEFKRFESGIDLDVKVFPKNNEKLLVEDSEQIVQEASVKPANFANKIFVINNIDLSTEAAQNKLLKVIEEPPKNVYFLISAKNEQNVLQTIKSRCNKTKIPPFTQDEIANFFDNKLAIILGKGFWGRTQELTQNQNLSEIVNFGVSLATNLKNSKQVLKFSKYMIDQKENLKLILEVLLTCLEDIVKIKCEQENLCKLAPIYPELKQVETEFSVQAVCEICKLASRFMEKIEFNANLNVAVDNFLLKMLEVKYLCK